MNNNKGFSIIEIIITISIIILLTVIGISSKRGYDENISNTKVVSDTKTINNALDSYVQDNSTLPMPGGNVNFFGADTSYMHNYEDINTFGVYGSLTEKTLPKKYLDNLPLDPRTNSYYSYGKAKKTNEFEVASIQVIDSTPISKVIGNYKAENGPYNLIREYNGSNFVYNGSEKNFPYNPDELILIATDKNGIIYRQGDTITVPAGEELEIYFSDGSVSILGDPIKQTILTLNELNFKGKDNLNTLVKLGLEAGKIWTKATKLNTNSEFEITTKDSSAAVRGTIFGVERDITMTKTIVIEGSVEILKNDITKESIEKIIINKGEPIKELDTYNNSTEGILKTPYNIILPTFSINDELRSNQTIAGINKNKCISFEIDGVCVENENYMPKDNGWKIISYAPFNGFEINNTDIEVGFNKSYKMFGSGNVSYNINQHIYGSNRFNPSFFPNNLSFNTPIDGCKKDCNLLENGFFFNDNNNIIKDTKKNISGIYISNNIDNKNYLKYENLNLHGNFAIEMNVLIPNITNDTNLANSDKYFLLHGGYDLMLYIQNNKLYFRNTSKNGAIYNISGLIPGGYNKITLINENSVIKVKIGDNQPIELLGYYFNNTIINNIIVGAFFNGASYQNQINNIIDYVKIYKK